MLRRWPLLPAFLAMFACATGAWAQSNWPTKSIRWIVPYTPGGITDSVTRLVTERLQERLGQNIVVENKPGANSILGADVVAKAPPDGYTILTVIAAHAANATLYKGKLNFDPVDSFAPISLAAVAPLMVTVNPSFAPRDMKELIAYAKANPGKVSFGSSGIDMVHIPFKGTAPGVAAAVAGDIQVEGDVPSSLMPYVRAGKLRAICVYASKRSAGAPEVPTIVEAGGPPIEGSTWIMFLAPAGTPQSIVNRISEETARIVNDPAMKERFEKLGIDAAGTTPAQTRKYLQDEIVKWGKVIEVAGVKPEA